MQIHHLLQLNIYLQYISFRVSYKSFNIVHFCNFQHELYFPYGMFPGELKLSDSLKSLFTFFSINLFKKIAIVWIDISSAPFYLHVQYSQNANRNVDSMLANIEMSMM